MNIFGIGGAELVLIVLIMLIVAGPKRMIQWAYVLGVWAGKARMMWQQAVTVLQKEMDDAGVNIRVPTEPPTRQTLTRMVTDAVKPYTAELESTYQQIELQARGEAVQPPVRKPSTLPAKVAVPAPIETQTFGAWNGTPPSVDASSLGTWSAPRSVPPEETS